MVATRWLGGPAKAVGSLVAVAVALRLAFPGEPAPAGVLVYGAVIGLLYSLISFGLILVHRASRIINFAQAEIGAAAAVLAVLLIKVHDWPYLLALPLALIVGTVSGLLVDVLVIRRFAKAPRLVLSVATIGLSRICGAFPLLLPVVFGATTDLGIDASPIETPFSGIDFEISPVVFDANSIIVLAGTGLVLAALIGFFRFTDIGYAVRASAENVDRALLLGIPVARVGSIVWMIAGALSALGLFLRVPLTGLPVGTSVGPYVLLYALAAAVIARMQHFGIALVAAVGLGMAEQAMYFSTRDALVPVALTLPVLLAAMLLQRGRQSRGEDTGISTWSLSAEHRLIPPELRGLPEVRWGRALLLLAVLGAVVVLPHVVGPTQQTLSSVVVIYGIVAVSLVILTGWSGQISLGQWGFTGLGAAVAGGFATRLSGDFFVSLMIAGLVGAVAAVILGIPALRIQGLYLAVTTLSFALAVQVFVLNPRYFDWLLPPQLDRIDRPVIFERFDTTGDIAFYYLCLLFLVLCLGSARALRQSRAGRLLVAVRDNQRGVRAFGVSASAVRLWAFAISGFWAALAGALFAYHQGSVEGSAFPPDLSLTLLMLVVIGGSTSLPGAMIGTAYFGILRYAGLDPRYQLLTTGIGTLLLLLFLPGGLAQVFYGARDRLLRLVAARRGILVPSLVADKRVDEDQPHEAEPTGISIEAAADRDLGSISFAATVERLRDEVPA